MASCPDFLELPTGQLFAVTSGAVNLVEIVRANVKRLLSEQGKSQKDLGVALGYKRRQSITEFLSGRQGLPAKRFEAIARFFSISLDTLIERHPAPAQPEPATQVSLPVEPVPSDVRKGRKNPMVLTDLEAGVINMWRGTKNRQAVHEAVDLAFGKKKRMAGEHHTRDRLQHKT